MTATRWLQRGMLLALVLAGPDFRLGSREPADAAETSGEAALLLRQAGYRVSTSQSSWAGVKHKGAFTLTGRHPDCRSDIVVSFADPGHFGDLSAGRIDARTFVYGDWSGAVPTRLRLIEEAARIRLHAMLEPTGSPPPRTMLVVADPSACLLLDSPRWRRLWYRN